MIAAIKEQPGGYRPGIYFGLPDEEYHADMAMSHSGILKLAICPGDYWEAGPLNIHRVVKDTTASMEFGTIMHQLLFEPERFHEEYNVTGSYGSDTRKPMNKFKYQEYLDIIEAAKSSRDIRHLLEDGMPEVSIVWIDEDTGIRCRARIDWLKPGYLADYKTIKEIDKRTIGQHVANYGYDVQAAMYIEGIKAVKKLLRSGKGVVGGEVDEAWLKRFLDAETDYFCFMFQRASKKPFPARPMTMDYDILDEGLETYKKGLLEYKRCIQAYGVEKWPPGFDEIDELSVYQRPRVLRFN